MTTRITLLAITYCLILTAYLVWTATAGRPRDIQEGVASWYGEAYRGRTTASGSVFNPDELTAAHKFMEFGTRVRCSYGGKSVVVTITDRGPYVKDRVLDLSEAAFSKLAHTDAGLIKVKYEILK